jgi:hypothetical protein
MVHRWLDHVERLYRDIEAGLMWNKL